jgi:hypothetical protein
VTGGPIPGDLAHWLRLVVEPGSVVELRILECVDNPKYGSFTVAGYFDSEHLDELADAAMTWTRKAGGCYTTLNSVRSCLLARAANRIVRRPRQTTTDADVERRSGLVFDVDSVRPGGISATQEEKALARETIDRLGSYLAALGWPDPILVDSGNGYHARYRIDLPALDGGLVERVLKAAAARFSNKRVKIDTALFNPARIIKLPGTAARKGDDLPERPHRWARVLSIPAEFRVVPVDRLEALATEAKAPDGSVAICGNGQARSHPSNSSTFRGATPEERARSYVFAPGFPDSIAGQHGHDRLFHVACVLRDGFGLSFDRALPLLQEWNQTKAYPPESDKQLWHKLDGAIKKHPAPSLRLLNADRSGKRIEPDTTSPASDEIEPPIVVPNWPEPLDEAAFFGLAGEIVRAIEPHTEADPAAILMQLLIAYGNLIGRTAFAKVGPAFHHTNEYLLIIGETSVGRKGTAWEEVMRLLAPIDPDWTNRAGGGLSTGEGLIYHVRDQLTGKKPIEKDKRIVDYQDVILDHGVTDKRLMIIETEFARPLQAMRRDASTLSAVIRQGWDGHRLATKTKSFPYVATGAHVSIIGHITAEELCRLLTSTDLSNGFANRFLWVASRRTKLLPRGGNMPDDLIAHIQDRLRQAVAFGRDTQHVRWSNDALHIWDREYPSLTEPRPGSLGQVVNRAEPHTLRLGMLTALINESRIIEPDHLEAALAMVACSERSASYILGGRLGDRDEESILAYLVAKPTGASRSDIRREVFNDHKLAIFVTQRLTSLLRQGLVRSELQPTSGRPREMFFATLSPREKRDKREKGGANGPDGSLDSTFHANHAFHAHASGNNEPAEAEFEEGVI